MNSILRPTILSLLVAMASASVHKKDMLDMVNDVLKQNSASQNTNQKVESNDKGKFVPCSDTDPKFVLNWSPKDVKLGDTVVFNFDMTPTVDLSSGMVEVSLSIPDYPDPIYEVNQPFNCGYVHKVFPQFCPFKKNKNVNVSGYKYKINPELPLPGGTFLVKATITNQKGELFACLSGQVNVVHDYDYNYDYNDY